MQTKKYVDKNGNEKIYNYETKQYDKKYNAKRDKTLFRLQRQKSYYKKIGDLEKVRTLDLYIAIEKRRIAMRGDK